MIGEGVAAVLLVTVVDSSRDIRRMVAKLQIGDLLLGDFIVRYRNGLATISTEAVKFGGKSKRTNRYTFERLDKGSVFDPKISISKDRSFAINALNMCFV